MPSYRPPFKPPPKFFQTMYNALMKLFVLGRDNLDAARNDPHGENLTRPAQLKGYNSTNARVILTEAASFNLRFQELLWECKRRNLLPRREPTAPDWAGEERRRSGETQKS